VIEGDLNITSDQEKLKDEPGVEDVDAQRFRCALDSGDFIVGDRLPKIVV
jgi:hypothetical protein